MTRDPAASETEGFIESCDGRRLFVRSWRPQRDVCANLAIVHDFNSHSGYYESFAKFMSNRRMAVHALDFHGCGKSPGEISGQRFADYVDDIDTLVSAVRMLERTLPTFLLGHGAGAVAAGAYALRRQRDLAGLICESIALELAMPAAARRIICAIAVLAPRLPALRLRNALLSRDQAIVTRMNSDPLIRERQSARTVAELVRASARLRAGVAQLSLPLLVLHGSADAVSRPSGSEYLHEHAGSHDKTLQVFEGYYHDLINEQGSEHVVGRIHQWIEARLNFSNRPQIGIAYINADS